MFNQYGYKHNEDEQFIADEAHVIRLVAQKLDGDVTVSDEEGQMWMTLFPKAGFGDEVEIFANSMEIMTSDEVSSFIDTVEDNLYEMKGN